MQQRKIAKQATVEKIGPSPNRPSIIRWKA